jgi:cytochrome c553
MMTTAKRRSSLVLSLFLLLGLAGVAVGADPKTNLGKWMKPSTGAPMASDTPDFATLQTSFGKLAGAPAPPAASFPKWTGFVQAGLAAAQKSDAAGVKGACNGCHKATGASGTNYKDMYKASPDPALESWASANMP